ncbi:MAG: hypothetical protein ABI307_02980 [Mycobacterium sp.]
MEGDAGASRLIPADQPGTAVSTEDPALTSAAPSRRPSRLRGRGMVGVCAVLLALAAAVATGGYAAVRSHHESLALARDNAVAIAAAKDCVAATQAPDSEALMAAQQKIMECGTGNFAAQAAVYAPIIIGGYQAAKVHVKVAEIRAAVERDNDDGSVDLLVAIRVKVDNVEAEGREFGYRLRVQMAREAGEYKIARLDQVAK